MNTGTPSPIRLRPTTPALQQERAPISLEKILSSHFYRPSTPLAARPTQKPQHSASTTPQSEPVEILNSQVEIQFAGRSPKFTLNRSSELVIIDGEEFIGTGRDPSPISTPPPPKISRQSALTTAQIAVMSPEPAVPAGGVQPPSGTLETKTNLIQQVGFLLCILQLKVIGCSYVRISVFISRMIS